MFDRDWLRKLAANRFVGVVALVALAAFCITFLSLQVGATHPSEPYAWEGDGQQEQGAAGPFSLARSAAQIACADAYQARPKDPQQRDKRDLCAQFQAAAAAEKGADFAVLQTWLALAGFAAVLITLWLNIRATNAATQQAKTSQEAFEFQDRPWLKIVAVELGHDMTHDQGGSYRVRVNVYYTNIGSSPALTVDAECEATTDPEVISFNDPIPVARLNALEEKIAERAKDRAPRRAVFPGVTDQLGLNASVNLEAHQSAFEVFGSVGYKIPGAEDYRFTRFSVNAVVGDPLPLNEYGNIPKDEVRFFHRWTDVS